MIKDIIRFLMMFVAIFVAQTAVADHHFRYTYKGQTIFFRADSPEASECNVAGDTHGYIGYIDLPEYASDGNKSFKVTGIDPFAFSQTEVKGVIISNTITNLGENVFHGCRQLKFVLIGENVKSCRSLFDRSCVELTKVYNFSEYIDSRDIGGLYFGNLFENVVRDGEFIFTIDEADKPLLLGYIGWSPRISLPETFQGEAYYINDGAFRTETLLTHVEMPNTIEDMGDDAFFKCSNLQEVKLSSKLKYLRFNAFRECTSLKEISMPASLEIICSYAFDSSGLESIDMSPCVNLYRFDHMVFNACLDLTSAKFPEQLEEIGVGTFNDCTSLKSVKLPTRLKSLGERTFSGCTALEYVELPEVCEQIEGQCFYECAALREVKMPGVTKLSGQSQFNGCTSLTDIKLPDYLDRLDGSNSDPTLPVGMFRNCKSLKHINLPYNCWKIEDSAFNGCSSLEEILLPSGLGHIERYNYEGSPFYGCTNLRRIDNYSPLKLECGSNDWGYVAYYATEIINHPQQIGEFWFTKTEQEYPELCFVNAPSTDKVVMIDSYEGKSYDISAAVIERSDVKQVVLSEKTHRIFNRAFYKLSELRQIIIPASVVSIEDEAFYGCSRLERVVNYSDIDIVPRSTDNGYVGYYAKVVDNDPYMDGPFGFSKHDEERPVLDYVSPLLEDTAVVLPDDCKGKPYDVGGELFRETKWLEHLTIGPGVRVISDRAFYECVNIHDLVIPSTVTDIRDRAFRFCYDIKTIDNYSPLPLQAESDSYGYVASNASKVINHPTSIDGFHFTHTETDRPELDGCDGKSGRLELPSDYEGKDYDIGDGAFSDTEVDPVIVVIPKGVDKIGNEAFKGCDKLTKIYVANPRPPKCGKDTFDGVDKESCELNVPNGSEHLYRTAKEWDGFAIIKGHDFDSGVTNVISDRETMTVYSLDGVLLLQDAPRERLMELAPGVYVVNGKKQTVR